MNFLPKKYILIAQICFITFYLPQRTTSNDLRNLQNHRNGFLNLKDIADHWIGYPKSPYTSFSVTVNPTSTTATTPTSAPLVSAKPSKKKKKKYQKISNSKRRSDFDDYDESEYTETQRSREKLSYQDFEYDYDGPLDPSYAKNFAPSPMIFRASPSTPKTVMVNPSVSSSSNTMKAIYAGTPKVATYVVPNAKKYVVQRVKSQMVYAPPVMTPPNPRMYAAASNSGMRRLDPLDYDDNGGRGSFLGPQDSFPPRPVLNKITEPGSRQPCHGPECHQHHKGLVRFYWRRVVYPRNARGRLRGRGRRPRRGRNRRVRPRNRSRAPSDQKDVYYTEDDENAEENEDEPNAYANNEEEEEDEEEDDEDNEENDTSRRNVWQPGKAYGHDLNEGTNYDDDERKVYRDKRYTYKSGRRQRKGSFK